MSTFVFNRRLSAFICGQDWSCYFLTGGVRRHRSRVRHRSSAHRRIRTGLLKNPTARRNSASLRRNSAGSNRTAAPSSPSERHTISARRRTVHWTERSCSPAPIRSSARRRRHSSAMPAGSVPPIPQIRAHSFRRPRPAGSRYRSVAIRPPPRRPRPRALVRRPQTGCRPSGRRTRSSQTASTQIGSPPPGSDKERPSDGRHRASREPARQRRPHVRSLRRRSRSGGRSPG